MKDKKLFNDCELDLILLSDDVITTSEPGVSPANIDQDDVNSGDLETLG